MKFESKNKPWHWTKCFEFAVCKISHIWLKPQCELRGDISTVLRNDVCDCTLKFYPGFGPLVFKESIYCRRRYKLPDQFNSAPEAISLWWLTFHNVISRRLCVKMGFPRYVKFAVWYQAGINYSDRRNIALTINLFEFVADLEKMYENIASVSFIHMKASRITIYSTKKRMLVIQYLYVPFQKTHQSDVIMTTMASQITSLTVIYSIDYSDADQRKHQSSALLTFVRGIHRWPVNPPHKGPVTRKMFPFDDVIIICSIFLYERIPTTVIRLLDLLSDMSTQTTN